MNLHQIDLVELLHSDLLIIQNEEEEDYVEQSKLGKFGNAFQTFRESPFSTIAAISQGLQG